MEGRLLHTGHQPARRDKQASGVAAQVLIKQDAEKLMIGAEITGRKNMQMFPAAIWLTSGAMILLKSIY